jgi:parvulin-like peptidyl-prolyl isomerase
LSARIFGYSEGQVSEPVETETGWYIVKCGKVQPGTRKSFADAQDEIRAAIRERRFSQELADYVLRLAEKATIVGMDTFVAETVRRAMLAETAQAS